ncbi:MAG: hypothetical protein J0H06_01410, partial [Actinobacteria bacterium]|nr:hypothetical protein [Actinomycetota bacterium]
MNPYSSILQVPVVAIYGGGAISAAALGALLRSELIEVTIPDRAEAESIATDADVVLLAGLAHTDDPAGLARRHGAKALLLVDRPLTLETTLQLGAAGSVCRECSAERLSRAVHTIAAG